MKKLAADASPLITKSFNVEPDMVYVVHDHPRPVWARWYHQDELIVVEP